MYAASPAPALIPVRAHYSCKEHLPAKRYVDMTALAEATAVVAALLLLTLCARKACSPVRRHIPRHGSLSEIAVAATPGLLERVRGAVWKFFFIRLATFLEGIISLIFCLVIRLISLCNWRRRRMHVCVVADTEPRDHFPSNSHSAQLAHHPPPNVVLSPAFAALMRPGVEPISPAKSTATGVSVRRKTLVLDLDETLVHAQFKHTDNCDVRLDIMDNQFPTVFYVAKRPYLDLFLRTTAQWYDIAIFTASLQKYADPLISTLDTHHVVRRRLFRQDCSLVNGAFAKDLTKVQPNLSDVLIVDNSPATYSIHPANAVPIEAWYSDPNDEELLNLLPLLYSIAFLEDVRSLLQLRLTRGALAAKRSRK